MTGFWAFTYRGISITLLLAGLVTGLPCDSRAIQGEPGEDLDELGDEFELLQEEDIVYSAAKHEQDIAESPSAVTVITREQIENTHCNDLPCLLRQTPGVDVRMVRPLYTLVGAQAYSEPGYAPRSLVLVDGREINIEFFGFASWQALPVHLEDVERVEVIRGPGSALYGANAHSMVVSITTRKPKENAARVFLGGGEHDLGNLHLNVDRVLGNWMLHVSGDHETTGHWRLKDRRECEINRVRMRLDHESGSLGQSLQLGLTTGEGMVHTGIAPGELDGYIGHAALFHHSELLRAQVTYRFLDTDVSVDLPLYFGGTKLGEMPEKWHVFTSDLDAEAQITWEPFGGNLLIAGGNYRWIHLEMEQNDPPSTEQHRIGAFLHDEQRLSRDVVLTAGIRFDYNNITPFTVSPRIAGIWRFARDQFLRLSVGRAFRKPNFFNTSVHFTGVRAEPGFEELTKFFHDGIGNEKVGNENITAFEAGYRGRFLEGRLKLEADLFFNLYRDTISFVVEIETNDMGFPDLPNSVMKFVNQQGGVNALGGSLALTWSVLEDLRLSASYTLRHSWYVSKVDDDYAAKDTAVGDRVPWEHAHLFNLSLQYLPERGPRLGAALQGASSADTAMPGDGTIFGEEITVHSPAKVFVSGFAAWRFRLGSGWLEAGVRAFNLLGAGFRDSPSVTREDGVEMGGELIGRQVFFFLRGTL